MLIAAGIVLISAVTLALYFETRQLDYVPPSLTPTPSASVNLDAETSNVASNGR